jgi:Tol biopolymer transport system component
MENRRSYLLCALALSMPLLAVHALETRLLFVSDREGSRDIWVMDREGQNPEPLTKDKKHHETDPTGSPTGDHVAYTSDDGLNRSRRIIMMNADGKNDTVLTEAIREFPVWSPDGSTILCAGLAGNSLSLYVLQVGEWEPEVEPFPATFNVTGAPSTDMTPAWSHDGTKVVFSSNRKGGNLEIFVMDIDLENADPDFPAGLIRLTDHDSVDREPTWSPDGKHIAFSTNRDGNWEIYVMDTLGENLVNLTNHPGVDQLPRWSPDGSAIAFASNRDGNWEIYAMETDGANPTNLTNNPARDVQPAWLADTVGAARPVSVRGKQRTVWSKIKSVSSTGGELRRAHP